MKCVNIPDALLLYLKEEASKIHHGRIIIDINVDRPDNVDVIIETRERFSTKN